MLPGSCSKSTGKSLSFRPLHDCACRKGRNNRQPIAVNCSQEQKVLEAVDGKVSKSAKQAVSTSVPNSASEDPVKAPLNIQAADSFELPTTMHVPITAGRVPYSLHPQLVVEHKANEESRDNIKDMQTANSHESGNREANQTVRPSVDAYTSLLSKATIAVHVFHAQFLCFWPYFAAANTIVASELAAIQFWQGACGLVAVALAHKLAQFAVSCHTQGARALFGAQQYEKLEAQLKSVVKKGRHRLRPDSEESPTPALQFFCSGTVSSAAAVYITIKAAQFMNSYAGFEGSSALLSLLAAFNALGLVCACLLCLDLAIQGRFCPDRTDRTPATA